jgi:hypothetical protein
LKNPLATTPSATTKQEAVAMTAILRLTRGNVILMPVVKPAPRRWKPTYRMTRGNESVSDPRKSRQGALPFTGIGDTAIGCNAPAHCTASPHDPAKQ